MTSVKTHALEETEAAWQEFQDVLAQIPLERTEEPGVVGEWSIKDLAGHITTWEAEMMANLRCVLAHPPGEMRGYPDVDAFNLDAARSKASTRLADLLFDLHETHGKTVQLLEDLPESALEIENVKWRIRIDTYEHYRGHVADIRRWLAGGGTA